MAKGKQTAIKITPVRIALDIKAWEKDVRTMVKAADALKSAVEVTPVLSESGKASFIKSIQSWLKQQNFTVNVTPVVAGAPAERKAKAKIIGVVPRGMEEPAQPTPTPTPSPATQAPPDIIGRIMARRMVQTGMGAGMPLPLPVGGEDISRIIRAYSARTGAWGPPTITYQPTPGYQIRMTAAGIPISEEYNIRRQQQEQQKAFSILAEEIDKQRAAKAKKINAEIAASYEELTKSKIESEKRAADFAKSRAIEQAQQEKERAQREKELDAIQKAGRKQLLYEERQAQRAIIEADRMANAQLMQQRKIAAQQIGAEMKLMLERARSGRGGDIGQYEALVRRAAEARGIKLTPEMLEARLMPMRKALDAAPIRQFADELRKLERAMKFSPMPLAQGQAKLNELIRQYGVDAQTATEASTRLMRAFESKGDSLQRLTGKVFGWAVATGTLYGGIRLLGAGVQDIIEIEKATARMSTTFRFGDNIEELKNLRDGIFAVSLETRRSTTEGMRAAQQFARAGLNRIEIIKATREAQILANLTDTDAVDKARDLIQVYMAFNKQAGEIPSINDAIAVTARDTIVNADELASTLARAGETAEQAGLSYQELAAYAGILGQATGKMGEAFATAFKRMVQMFEDPKLQRVLERRGVKLFTEEGELRGYMELLGELKLIYDSLDSAQGRYLAVQLVGRRQAQELTAALTNYFAIARQVVQNYLSQGEAAKLNQRMMRTWAAETQNLKTQFEQLAVAVGESGLRDFLVAVVKVLESILGALTGFSKYFPVFEILASLFAIVAFRATFMNTSLLASRGAFGLLARTGHELKEMLRGLVVWNHAAANATNTLTAAQIAQARAQTSVLAMLAQRGAVGGAAAGAGIFARISAIFTRIGAAAAAHPIISAIVITAAVTGLIKLFERLAYAGDKSAESIDRNTDAFNKFQRHAEMLHKVIPAIDIALKQLSSGEVISDSQLRQLSAFVAILEKVRDIKIKSPAEELAQLWKEYEALERTPLMELGRKSRRGETAHIIPGILALSPYVARQEEMLNLPRKELQRRLEQLRGEMLSRRKEASEQAKIRLDVEQALEYSLYEQLRATNLTKEKREELNKLLSESLRRQNDLVDLIKKLEELERSSTEGWAEKISKTRINLNLLEYEYEIRRKINELLHGETEARQDNLDIQLALAEQQKRRLEAIKDEMELKRIPAGAAEIQRVQNEIERVSDLIEKIKAEKLGMDLAKQYDAASEAVRRLKEQEQDRANKARYYATAGAYEQVQILLARRYLEQRIQEGKAGRFTREEFEQFPQEIRRIYMHGLPEEMLPSEYIARDREKALEANTQALIDLAKAIREKRPELTAEGAVKEAMLQMGMRLVPAEQPVVKPHGVSPPTIPLPAGISQGVVAKALRDVAPGLSAEDINREAKRIVTEELTRPEIRAGFPNLRDMNQLREAVRAVLDRSLLLERRLPEPPPPPWPKPAPKPAPPPPPAPMPPLQSLGEGAMQTIPFIPDISGIIANMLSMNQMGFQQLIATMTATNNALILGEFQKLRSQVFEFARGRDQLLAGLERTSLLYA